LAFTTTEDEASSEELKNHTEDTTLKRCFMILPLACGSMLELRQSET